MGKLNGDVLCSGRPALLHGGEYAADPAAARPHNYNTARPNMLYIEDEATMKQAMDELRAANPKILGLDIETTGGFKAWAGSVRLIQVGIEDPEPRQFVFDCWRVEPAELIDFLSDPEKEMVTCNGIFEQEWLSYQYGLDLTNVFDVCYASKLLTKTRYGKSTYVGSSYRDLMRRYVGKKIAKTQQNSEWDRAILDRHQKKYAAQDVSGALDIRRALMRELEMEDIVDLVREDTDGRIARARDRVELYGDRRHDQVDRIMRHLAHAKDISSMDRLLQVERQMTLPFDLRAKVRAEIHKTMDRLVQSA